MAIGPDTTHALAVAWLQQRRRLWPHTTNPHLLISQITAADSTDPPIAHTVTDATFQRLGISPGRLRRDRILDEAHHTADPVHLMRVFGIGAKAAMTYIQAAHPEPSWSGASDRHLRVGCDSGDRCPGAAV